MVKIIGFDLDGVFIDHPPFVPKDFIEWLYRDHQKKELSYRFPGQFEQKIRRLSHLPFIRPPITANCELVKKIIKQGKFEFYLISGRFGFLKDLTYAWLKRHNMQSLFKKIYLNRSNLQPHRFKESMLKKIKIQSYIDDDYDSLYYLAEKFPGINFYCHTQNRLNKKNTNNLKIVNNLKEIFDA